LPRLLRPRALPPGGTLGIAAPAGPVDPERLEAGCRLWREAGYRVVYGEDLLARRGYLAGDDARRAGELMQLWKDPEVDAIVCARGGYGCHRIVGRLDAHAVRAARKPLVGYSDITTLLLWQRRAAGLVGFHGPMLERGGGLAPPAFRALVDAVSGTGPARVCLAGTGHGGGRARGRLLGGSLAVLAASLGTPWEPSTTGAILLLEDVNERPFRIDRCLAQLRAAGKLAGIAGLGAGGLVGCTDPRYPEPGARAVVLEAAADLGVPVVTDLPFGHVDANRVWPVGARAEIDGERGEITLLERGVESR